MVVKEGEIALLKRTHILVVGHKGFKLYGAGSTLSPLGNFHNARMGVTAAGREKTTVYGGVSLIFTVSS